MMEPITNATEIPEIRAPQPPKLEGYMEKLKHNKSSLFSAWARRYFRINANKSTLEYFHKLKEEGIEYSRVPSKSFKLTDIQHVYAIDDLCLQIDLTYQKSLILRTTSSAEKNRWIMNLSNYIISCRVKNINFQLDFN